VSCQRGGIFIGEYRVVLGRQPMLDVGGKEGQDCFQAGYDGLGLLHVLAIIIINN